VAKYVEAEWPNYETWSVVHFVAEMNLVEAISLRPNRSEQTVVAYVMDRFMTYGEELAGEMEQDLVLAALDRVDWDRVVKELT